MPRSARISFPGAVYHIMNRGNNRQKIFLDSEDYLKYLELLREYAEQFRVIVYAYCLMGTHLHLLLETCRANLSTFMKSLNIRYMLWYKKHYHLIGHLFQGRFKSIIVDKDNYLLELTRYIHLNPVRVGMVERPEEYPWSSFHDYFSEREGWVTTETVLGYFGEGHGARNKYKEFVAEGLKESIGLPPLYAGIIYGSKDFALPILKLRERRRENKSGRLRRRVDREKYKLMRFEEILEKTSNFYGVKPKDLLNNREKHLTRLRHCLMYLLRRLTTLSLAEIGEQTGPIQHSAVSLAIKRLEEKRKSNKKLAQQITALEEAVTGERL